MWKKLLSAVMEFRGERGGGGVSRCWSRGSPAQPIVHTTVRQTFSAAHGKGSHWRSSQRTVSCRRGVEEECEEEVGWIWHFYSYKLFSCVLNFCPTRCVYWLTVQCTYLTSSEPHKFNVKAFTALECRATGNIFLRGLSFLHLFWEGGHLLNALLQNWIETLVLS